MTAKDGEKESHLKETKENQDTDHHQKDMENRRIQKDMEREHQKENQLQQHHPWQVRRNDIEITE